MVNKKDLRGGAEKIREVAQLLFEWANDLESSWMEIKDRNRVPVRTTETAAEYPKLSKDQRDQLKDQGGFVGGWLREGIRKNGNVISRCVGCLDADSIPEGVNFPALVRSALSGVEWFLYSTHKHVPEAPRFRLVILFDREVSEDEYAIAAIMMQLEGWEKSWERKRIPIYGQQRLYFRKDGFQPVDTGAYRDRTSKSDFGFLD